MGMAFVLGNMAELARDEGDYRRAQELLTQVLRIWQELRSSPMIAAMVIMFGVLAIREGALIRGVRLIGAGAIVTRPLLGVVHFPDLDGEATASLAMARSALGEEAYAAAWAAGQALTLEQAVAVALAEEPER
jgi:hypothetical protein